MANMAHTLRLYMMCIDILEKEALEDIYRKVIYCRHLDYDILIKVKDVMKQKYEQQFQSKEVVIQFDFNPMNNY